MRVSQYRAADPLQSLVQCTTGFSYSASEVFPDILIYFICFTFLVRVIAEIGLCGRDKNTVGGPSLLFRCHPARLLLSHLNII